MSLLTKISKLPLDVIKMTNISKVTPRASKEKIGKAPGTLIYTGKPRKEKVRIKVMDYNQTKLKEITVKNIEEVFKFGNTKTTTWVNISGVHDLEIIKKLGEHFNLHKLLLEDVTNTSQRPKLENYEKNLFCVLKMISFKDSENKIESEQISLIILKNIIISFQEKEGDLFEPVRNRIREGKTKIRSLGNDYLAYALMDIIVDNYFAVLEKIGEEIEKIESDLIKNTSHLTQNNIYRIKRELIILRKSVWPLREVISGLQREEKIISSNTKLFLRDLYDHTIQLIDTIETFRDMLSGMLDLYMTKISNKMNEVMKVLTIIATIFIPLTFIAGIYGMNFQYMPELGYKYAYPLVWGVMIFTGVSMLIYFRKKKWL